MINTPKPKHPYATTPSKTLIMMVIPVVPILIFGQFYPSPDNRDAPERQLIMDTETTGFK